VAFTLSRVSMAQRQPHICASVVSLSVLSALLCRTTSLTIQRSDGSLRIRCLIEEEKAKMPKSEKLTRDRTAALLNTVGGEHIAGSGFETEEPDRGFATDDLSEDESPSQTD